MASTEAQVAHVWRRLGFGPAAGDVEAGVAAGGAPAVIEQLLARPTTALADWAWPADQGNSDDHQRYLQRLFELWAHSPSVVQERVSWILSGMVVASLDGLLTAAEMRAHHNRLRAYPAAASYRSMLEDIANTATMQKYLSGVFSVPPHPNENLARELMELFSLGVTNPRTGAANYTETDVKEISRALTGYRMAWDTGAVFYDSRFWDSGTKTFLGADRGAAKLPEVMNAIVAHDSFKYFVPQRMYRELMGFDPSASALDEMAGVWAGNGGNLSALVAHIARRPEFLADATIRNRVKSPVELITSTVRVLGKKDLSGISVGFLSGIMRQIPTLVPDVSGWDGNWLHPSHIVMWSHVAYWLSYSDHPAKDGTAQATPVAQQNPTVRKLFAEATRETAADMALRLAGLHDVSPQTRSAIDAYARHVAWTGEVWSWERACGVMQMVFISPEFLAS